MLEILDKLVGQTAATEMIRNFGGRTTMDFTFKILDLG
jgi:hypothetical protein